MRALRQRGHSDTGAPRFDADVTSLRAATALELTRSQPHTVLPLNDGIPIVRDADAPLRTAMVGHSLLVIGEPGAGKTGALVSAALALQSADHEVLFLSVDRFPGVTLDADLATQLRLANPLLDVLAARPGVGRKILVIDALDAARGGLPESVFATLIEAVIGQLSADWTVIASIRTFDLRHGRRFKAAFAGVPADPAYVDDNLQNVRHFLVRRLSPAEVTRVGAASDPLRTLLASAPPRLSDLLVNIFNLSLAAQLLDDGADPSGFSAIATQSGLIDAYEDARLTSSQLQQAAGAVARSMATRRRLSVRKVTIEHPELDTVIRRGVLTEAGDLVSFSHHVLFDHVAGRFHLAWNEPGEMMAQLAGDTSTALLLAPAMRFALERLWRRDAAGKAEVWRFAAEIFSTAQVNPVLGNVAARVAAEGVEGNADVDELLVLATENPESQQLATLLGLLTQFAAIAIKAANPLPPGSADAWARVAAQLIATGSRILVQPAFNLLSVLFERGDMRVPAFSEVYGRASRGLLQLAWSLNPPLATRHPIRFVGKSFASEPAASRALLDRALREPHFSLYADQEAGGIADQIVTIAHADADFMVEIYAALYGQTINDEATSFVGGPSRIMPMMTSRKASFESCRWQLGTKLGEILQFAPEQGTRAIIEAEIGLYLLENLGTQRAPLLINLQSGSLELRGRVYEFGAWDAPAGIRNTDDAPLYRLIMFLRSCGEPEFSAVVAGASRGYATLGVWVRIFGVGRERSTEVGHLLWALATNLDFLKVSAIAAQALRLVAAMWPTRSAVERNLFEITVLDEAHARSGESLQGWIITLMDLFENVPETEFVLEGMGALRRSIPTSTRVRLGALGDIDGFQNPTVDLVAQQPRTSNAELDDSPADAIASQADALSAQTRAINDGSSAAELASLWSSAMAVHAALRASSDLPHEIDRVAWGRLGGAAERVASHLNFQPGQDGLPDLASLIVVLDALTSSRYPEPPETSA